MPKGKPKMSSKGGSTRKGTGGSKSRRGGGGLSDDESLNGDAGSILSLNSDRGSYEDGEIVGIDGKDNDDGGNVGMQSRETLEEKIAEAIDAMTEKSSNTRMNSLNTLTTVFSQQFVPELVLNRRETLRDNLEKIFKRGPRSEQGVAAGLASLAALQTGAYDLDTATEDFSCFKPMLQSIVLDHTVPVLVRVKCVQAACLGAFLAEDSIDDVCNLINILQPLFEVQIKKKIEEVTEVLDGAGKLSAKTVKLAHNTCGNLASAAISSWSLLITLMPLEYVKQRSLRWAQMLLDLLDQAELEVRLSAGEALALLVEICEMYLEEEDCLSEDEDKMETGGEHTTTNGHTNGHVGIRNGISEKVIVKVIISKLRQLSVESVKYRTKRDRRTQRHSFRDFLHAVENGDDPGQSIKFGCGEVLEIDSWVKKRQYDAMCQVLGSGINRHLIENVLVRQIMELGAPRPTLSDGGYGAKQAKNDRHLQNAANFKARCVSRGKSRDHRMATLSDY